MKFYERMLFMKSTIKKYICAALAAATAITIICAGFTTAFAETAHKYISIEIDSETFRDFDKMFCYIYDLTDETEVAKWGSKNGAMTKDIDSDIWRFDLDEHEIELNPEHKYTVVFSSDWKAQTEVLKISSYDSAKDYTAVFSNILTWKSFSFIPEFKYIWAGEPLNRAAYSDLNSDGKVDVIDAAVIQKYTSGRTELNDEQLAVSDVNADGTVDILDAAEIQKYAAE